MTPPKSLSQAGSFSGEKRGGAGLDSRTLTQKAKDPVRSKPSTTQAELADKKPQRDTSVASTLRKLPGKSSLDAIVEKDLIQNTTGLERIERRVTNSADQKASHRSEGQRDGSSASSSSGSRISTNRWRSAVQELGYSTNNVRGAASATTQNVRATFPRLSTVSEEPNAQGPRDPAPGATSVMSSATRSRGASGVASPQDGPLMMLPPAPKLKPWQTGRPRARFQDTEAPEVKRKLGPQNVRFVYSESVEKELRKKGVSLNLGRMNGWTNQIQFVDNCTADIDQLSDIHNDAIRRSQRRRKVGRWGNQGVRIMTTETDGMAQSVGQNMMSSAIAGNAAKQRKGQQQQQQQEQRRVSFAQTGTEQQQHQQSLQAPPQQIMVVSSAGPPHNAPFSASPRVYSYMYFVSRSPLLPPKPSERPWRQRGFSRTSVKPVHSAPASSPCPRGALLPTPTSPPATRSAHTPKVSLPQASPEPAPPATTSCFITDLEVAKKLPQLSTCPSITYKTGKVALFCKFPEELKHHGIPAV